MGNIICMERHLAPYFLLNFSVSPYQNSQQIPQASPWQRAYTLQDEYAYPTHAEKRSPPRGLPISREAVQQAQ